MARSFYLSNLTKSFLKLFVVYLILILLGGILFTSIEEDCTHDDDIKHGYRYTAEVHTLCKELKLSFPEGLDLDQPSISPYFQNLSCVLKKYCAFDMKSMKIENLSLTHCYLPVVPCIKWKTQNLLKWASFSSATIFTIGYGEPTPKTTVGRITTIFYALIGIPIALAMAGIGGQLIICKLSIVIDMLEHLFQLDRRGEHKTMKIFLAVIISFAFSLLGGCLISATGHLSESHWTVSLYFWFQTITTIGYGDVPIDRGFFSGFRLLLIVPYILFVIFGLALMSALLNLFATVIMSGEWRNYCCCTKDENGSRKNKKESILMGIIENQDSVHV